MSRQLKPLGDDANRAGVPQLARGRPEEEPGHRIQRRRR
jgi:hypothetical protein